MVIELRRCAAVGVVAMLLPMLVGCEPQDQRPGLWLRGDVEPFPTDVAFTDAYPEIALELRAPYGLPHSVTIWCATAGDQLFVAAARPDTKRWPGWVENAPNVRLKVGERLFEARLERLEDEAEIRRVQAAYASKYDLERAAGGAMLSRVWRVEPRADDF